MYTTHERLAAFIDTHLAESTVLRLQHADRCSVCKTPPGPPRGSHEERATWASRFGSRLGDRFFGRKPFVDAAHQPIATYDDAELSRLVHDSQLRIVVGLPEDVVAPLLAELTEDEQYALANELAFAMCDRCVYSPTIAYETAEAIRERYIDERFNGDAAALALLDVADSMRRLLRRVEAIMRRRAS
jgi:hypothetical protein